MSADNNQEWDDALELPQPSSSDLRGRQSVRATFKLSQRAIEAISIVATHLGIKQKSLFDHLMEDLEALKLIAREVGSEGTQFPDRVQKTFVISRRTLSSLDRTSKAFNAPRDALVEFSIQRLMPIIAREREKHRQRKRMLAEVEQYVNHGERLLQKMGAMVGEEDPVLAKYAAALNVLRSAYRSMHAFVDKGEVIEDF